MALICPVDDTSWASVTVRRGRYQRHSIGADGVCSACGRDGILQTDSRIEPNRDDLSQKRGPQSAPNGLREVVQYDPMDTKSDLADRDYVAALMAVNSLPS